MASSREELGREDQPASKKRGATRQITKDDDPESEEEEDGASAEPGTFRRASDQVLSERRIVKVRRTPTAPSSAPNPFAGILLVPPPQSVSQESVGAPPTGLNPNATPFVPVVAKREEQPPSTVAQVETSVENQTDIAVGTGETAEQESYETVVVGINSVMSHATEERTPGDATEEKPDLTEAKSSSDNNHSVNRDEEVKAVGASETSSVTFEQLSSAKNAFAGSFGTSFSSSSSTVTTALSHVSSGFAFGQPFSFGSQPFGSSTTFAFGQSDSVFAPKSGSGAFPTVSSMFGISNGSGANTFGSLAASVVAPKPISVVSLQEVMVETGEEKEKAIFTADAALFEFLDGGWKERGKGELKLNVSDEKDKRPRLVMRSKGNYRLLLNASLFPDMKLSKMDNRGITFACVNSAVEGKAGLTTYAVKLKDGITASDFTATVEANKGKQTSEPRTPESSPKATERPFKVAETRDIEA